MVKVTVNFDKLTLVYRIVLKKVLFNFIHDKDTKKFPKAILFLICFGLLLTLVVLQGVDCMKLEHLTHKMFSLAVMINVLSLSFRYYVFWTMPDELEILFLKFNDFYCNHHRPSIATKQLNETYYHVLRVNFWMNILITYNLLSWMVFPVIFSDSMMNLVAGYDVSYENITSTLPSLFASQLMSPMKETRYVFEICCYIIINLVWSSSCVLHYAIVVFIRIQFTILGNSIIKKDDQLVEAEQQAMSYRYFIEDHSKLLRTCKILDQISSPVVASILAATCFQIGALLFTVLTGLSGGSAIDLFFFYVQILTYLLFSLSDLYLFCWLSEITNTASLSVGEAVYDSDWYSKLRPCEKSPILMLQIAYKGVNIKALNMVDINLNTFMEVLKLSYSFFTIMRQGMNKPQQSKYEVLG